VTYPAGDTVAVRMHDGSTVRLHKTAPDYDPTDRDAAYSYVRARQREGEIATGLLFIDGSSPEMHAVDHTVQAPLTELPFEALCPGSAELEKLQARFR
jgi:2-oxoglutarate/2-oxoacid ferredoxin oxidoreductase subunit beta